MARFESLDDWLKWQEQLHPRPIDLGLERVEYVYRQLNNHYPKIPTITVAGTNGKGSSIAYLDAIYRGQGYKVGAYSSPHILRYNERIQINGNPVDDALICDAFERIDQIRGDISLSYFEFSTLAALLIFAEAGLDIQLLEVGLGGRLDAVNIIDPDVAIVTTIGIDHVEWLGNSLDAIGREKAGIFRSGRPAIIGDDYPPESLLAVAAEKQALVLQLGQQYHYHKNLDSWDWSSGQIKLTELPVPAFEGEHQYRNASAVLAAVNALQQQLPVTEQAVRCGLSQASLQGRFQLLNGSVPVLLDVAHNPQAIQTLVDYLDRHFATVKIHAVFAMMKDKDIASVLTMMADKISNWYLAPLSNPRAADEALLLDYFKQQNLQNIHCGYTDVAATVNDAKKQAHKGDLILVFGSFFLVSEYLAKFN